MNIISQIKKIENQIEGKIKFNESLSKYSWFNLGGPAKVIFRPKSLNELFEGVRSIHYKSYLNYFYFNIGRLAYLQANVLSAYILIAPAIVAGVMTLGVMQQLVRAFGRVEASMQYLFNSWPTLIELASVYKRLREFEQKLENLEEEIRV